MAAEERHLVMGFGTFDAIHPGHLFYLNELKKLGDELLIVIARDVNVERMKGKRAHHNEDDRLQAVIETGLADRVILGDKKDFLKVIRGHKPDVLGFGYDQQVNIDELKAQFPHTEMVRLKSHEPHKYRSSLIKAELFG